MYALNAGMIAGKTMKKKKSKWELYEVKEPMFKSGLTVLVNCSWDELKEYLEDRNLVGNRDEDIDSHRNSIGCLFHLQFKDDKDENRMYLLWQKKFSWTIEDIGTFVHELMHFTTAILDDKGIPIRYENDEVMAYFQEYYIKSFFHLMKPEASKLQGEIFTMIYKAKRGRRGRTVRWRKVA